MTIAKKQVVLTGLFLLFGFLQLATLIPTQTVQADQSLLTQQVGLNDVAKVYGNQKQDVRVVIGKIISIALGFLAVIFLALAIFAGFQYMTSGGNEEKTKKAMALLRNAIIGLVIVLMAWAITKFMVLMLSRAINNAVDYTNYNNGNGY